MWKRGIGTLAECEDNWRNLQNKCVTSHEVLCKTALPKIKANYSGN